MKKTHKKFLSFLTVICCLAGSLGTVQASGSGAVPRVVFENESDGSAALYVGKEIVDQDGVRVANPDTSVDFTFTLTLSAGADGEEPPRNLTYTLCDLSGNEFKKEDLGTDANSFRIENGARFTLKAGQMAKFLSIPEGMRYVISETPQSGYTQVYPEGGVSKSGFKQNENETFIFKNRVDTGGGEAKLEISKTFSFPDNFIRPVTPDFTFRLTLEGKPAAGIPYTIKDSTEPGGWTNGNGEFTLKGGQTAVFEGMDEDGKPYIENGVDYKVEEIHLPEGWRLLPNTGTNWVGGINGTTSLNFHNSEVSFTVSKEMEDGTVPDVDFRFELKEGTELRAGAKYYLYDTDSYNLILPEGSTNTSSGVDGPQYHETEAGGIFTLRAGQTAVFIGLSPTAEYSVKEIADPKYPQTVPQSTEGYTGQKVQNSIEPLIFKNDVVGDDGVLTVTKEVVNEKGDASETSKIDEFHFILYSKAADETETPVQGAVYTLGTGKNEKSYRTGVEGWESLYPSETYLDGLNAGEFILKANETATFKYLPAGTYVVKEVGYPEGYQPKAKEGKEPETAATQTDVLEQTGQTSFTFTNSYWSDKTDLKIQKTNPAGGPLEGAEFRLLKAEINDEKQETTTSVGTGISDAEGNISFDVPITEGTWYVEETKVPVGYQVMSGRLKIVIGRDSTTKLPADPVVTYEDGTSVPNVSDDPTQNPENNSGLAKYTLTAGNQTRNQVTLIIKNEYLYALPKTGGIGTAPYTLAGIALMTAAAFLYIRRRRPGRS